MMLVHIIWSYIPCVVGYIQMSSLIFQFVAYLGISVAYVAIANRQVKKHIGLLSNLSDHLDSRNHWSRTWLIYYFSVASDQRFRDSIDWGGAVKKAEWIREHFIQSQNEETLKLKEILVVIQPKFGSCFSSHIFTQE